MIAYSGMLWLLWYIFMHSCHADGTCQALRKTQVQKLRVHLGRTEIYGFAQPSRGSTGQAVHFHSNPGAGGRDRMDLAVFQTKLRNGCRLCLFVGSTCAAPPSSPGRDAPRSRVLRTARQRVSPSRYFREAGQRGDAGDARPQSLEELKALSKRPV